ncbi:LemA family protein [Lysinibacillus sp. 2017]|uniref:LemA family protein n=1 Tax=unclassified Lysinibacillus TaxID=2636778 RepID=UPI000D52855E|nr:MULTISPECIES: LemA family protein [unclassified Lysinibacillus]AWE08608.1 LemA family protein [Lysinibacillus sp. 2017]TGN35697.1 LemA family protein [Lysinibacillus sp. S2017]
MKNEKGSALIIVIAIIAVIGIAAMLVIPKYNNLVTGEEKVDSAWAQVENQLQRRFDLIPNLVNTVKGYAKHEEEVFTQIAEARTKYGGADTVEETAEASNDLSSALSRLLVIVENYPELKADVQFTRLMDELAGTENRLAVARKDYNDTVQTFNNNVRRFPGNLIAGMFGFEKKDYFEIKDGVEESPTVDFGSDD